MPRLARPAVPPYIEFPLIVGVPATRIEIPMNVSFHCPDCEASNIARIADDGASPLNCANCAWHRPISVAAKREEPLRTCLVCACDELFVRKDFPQRLGVTLVIIGFVLSSVAWFYYWIYWAFGILFFFAALDLVLWLTMGECLVCYRCQAHIRGVPTTGASPFELATFERYRQLAARLAKMPNASQTVQAAPRGRDPR